MCLKFIEEKFCVRLITHNFFPRSIQSSSSLLNSTLPLIVFLYKQNQVLIPNPQKKTLQFSFALDATVIVKCIATDAQALQQLLCLSSPFSLETSQVRVMCSQEK